MALKLDTAKIDARLAEFKARPMKWPGEAREEALKAALTDLTAAVLASNETNAQLAKAVLMMSNQLRHDTQAVLRDLAAQREGAKASSMKVKRDGAGKISGASFD
jgi:hypothetical protein